MRASTFCGLSRSLILPLVCSSTQWLMYSPGGPGRLPEVDREMPPFVAALDQLLELGKDSLA